jgi:AcrR family transcriptional regulator
VGGPAQQRRTQAERRRVSEEALLAAAAELIAQRGVAGASLAKIGAGAGASSGLPIHHFGSKDALIARVAQLAQGRILVKIEARLEQAQRSMEDASGLELVRTMVDTYLEIFEHPSAAERALIVMWGATFPSDSSIAGMLEADRNSYDGWVSLLARGKRDGSIRADIDPAAASILLLGLTRSMAALLLTGSGLLDKDRVRAACDKWITVALGPDLESEPRPWDSGVVEDLTAQAEDSLRTRADRASRRPSRHQDGRAREDQNSSGARRSRART